MEKKPSIDPVLLKKFEARMGAVEDWKRGIPLAQITRAESTARRLHKESLEKTTDAKRTMELALSLRKEIEKTQADLIPPALKGITAECLFGEPATFSLREATLSETLRDLIRGGSWVVQARNFTLPFEGGSSFGFDVDPTWIDGIHNGMAGWGEFSARPPRIVNTGSGDGMNMDGNLDLTWSIPVPHTGIFRLPLGGRVLYEGTHRVRGEGWAWSSNDARAEIQSWFILYLDDAWITSRNSVVSWDATKSENRTKSFSAWIDLPTDIYFEARAGQSLGLIARLEAHTWANSEGLSEVHIGRFGMTANAFTDLDYIVED
jgi:hypothetical protein